MRQASTGFKAALQADATTFVLCWWIQKRDGVFIRGTEHDEDITLPSQDSPDEDDAGTYLAQAGIIPSDRQSSSDMSVDNQDVSGSFPEDDLININVSDIESGNLIAAPVQVLLVSWADPSLGSMIMGRGYLGEITRDSDFQWKTEVRGLLQLLSQPLGRTYGERCDVRRFGDARCKLDLAPLTISGTVTATGTRRNFGSDAASGAEFNSGEVTFTTGENDGFTRQVKIANAGSTPGNIILWDTFPFAIEIGDTFDIVQGCDRSWTRCKALSNTVNFRGDGKWIPGIPSILRAP